MDALKQRVADAVERLGDQLTALSLDIHAHPELAFEEHPRRRPARRFLAEQGFEVEAGVGGVADRVPRDASRPARGPTLAILCEYDALPGVGHACGHNVIARRGRRRGRRAHGGARRLPRRAASW